MQKNPGRSEQDPASLLDSCGKRNSYIACKYLCKVRKQHYSTSFPCMSYCKRKSEGKNLTVLWAYKQVEEHYRIYLIKGRSAFLALATVKSVIFIFFVFNVNYFQF